MVYDKVHDPKVSVLHVDVSLECQATSSVSLPPWGRFVVTQRTLEVKLSRLLTVHRSLCPTTVVDISYTLPTPLAQGRHYLFTSLWPTPLRSLRPDVSPSRPVQCGGSFHPDGTQCDSAR